MKNPQGYKCITLIFYLSFLLSAFEIRADESAALTETDNAIEEGWVEKRITPTTLWIESLFAPFTQWMESEIQREFHPREESPSNNSNLQLISVKKAIDTVLKKQPGKILRSQFKTGPPPHYKIKLLTKKGVVTIYNVHAFTGNLYTSNKEMKTKEAKP